MTKQAVVFAGQGAQAVGMGKDLADAYPACRALFTHANEILGYDLAKLCFEGPDTDLVKSNHCQPAIFVVSTVCYQALCTEKPGLAFAATAGLSLGEWTALHMAGVVSFADGLRILEARGRFMQEACEERAGGMLTIVGLPVEKVRELATAAGVEVANFNTPEQTVLSGDKDRILEAEKLANAAGAKMVVLLKVAGAYHSTLMASAARKLEAFLQTISFQPPSVPVMANVTGCLHGTVDEIKRVMVQQVTSSVQWVSCVRGLQEQGVSRYVECGPGRVLSGLVKKIQSDATMTNVQDRASLTKALPIIGA